MADMLATPSDLQTMPGLADLSDATATTLLEIATAVVQGETGQSLVELTDDTVTMLGTTDSWLDLPQRPVNAVTALTLDGTALVEGDDYKRFGSRLWRSCGWAACAYEPSTVVVTYDHGYPLGSRGLAIARSTVLMLAAGASSGPGVTSEGIDDYQVVYEKMASRMESAPSLRGALERRYGRAVGLVRLG